MSSPRREAKIRSPKKAGKEHTRARRKQSSTTTLAIIDGLLLRKMRVSINGKERELTVLAAIIHQLALKEAAGDARASRVLLKYEKLTRVNKSSLQSITFVNDDYMRRVHQVCVAGFV